MSETNKRLAPEFDQKQATGLLFPENLVTDRFVIKFRDNRILFSLRDKFCLETFLTAYQEAYFLGRIKDVNWLENQTSKIVSMCTLGCVPFVDFGKRNDWNPSEHDFEIHLEWLNQRIEFDFEGKIGEDFYYSTSITEGEGRKPHIAGNKVLMGLVLMPNELAKYRLRHAFDDTSYETRISFKAGVFSEEGDYSGRLQDLVNSIVIDIFDCFGACGLEKGWYGVEQSDSSKVSEIRLDQISDDSGSNIATISLKSFFAGSSDAKPEYRTLEVDFSLKIYNNMFARKNRALGQIQGVEAMNLFLIKCRQLKREISLQ